MDLNRIDFKLEWRINKCILENVPYIVLSWEEIDDLLEVEHDMIESECKAEPTENAIKNFFNLIKEDTNETFNNYDYIVYHNISESYGVINYVEFILNAVMVESAHNEKVKNDREDLQMANEEYEKGAL